MDAKYLAEIKARAQAAKAEKQKGNDLDCACLSWAIVLNDIPALLDEVERLTKEIETGRHMNAPINLNAASAESFCNAIDVSRLEQENFAKDQQIVTLEKLNASYEKILDGIRPNMELQMENAAKDQQISTLKAEAERLTDIEKEYVHYRRLSEESDQQIATLKRALELAVEDRTSNPKAIKKLVELHIQQAQEQEVEKC